MARRSRVLGAQSLRRKLKRMPDHIKRPVQDAIYYGAETIYADAYAEAPVGPTGNLKESLHKRISGDKLSAVIGYWKKGNIRKWRKAGWRAHFIEFGTVQHPSQPFLGPAALRNFPRVVQSIKSAVNRALDRASNL